MIVFSPPVFFSVLEKRRRVLSLTDKSQLSCQMLILCSLPEFAAAHI